MLLVQGEKMKSTYKYLVLALAVFAFIGFTGCDEISPPYTKDKGPVDTTTNKAVRKVLIEEYTGFRCGNCPAAAEIADSLKINFAGKIISLRVHSGPYALPKGTHTYDFRTTEGNELDNFFKCSKAGNPNGMVSRTGYSSDYIFREYKWEEIAKRLMALQPRLTINLSVNYNSSTREITVISRLKYLQAGSPDDNLVLYIVEDSVVNYQLDDSKNPPDINDYVHNDILRGSVSGTFGEQIDPTGLKAGDTITKVNRYTIPSTKDWRTNKLKIIAFVHDAGKTYEIYQVEEKGLNE